MMKKLSKIALLAAATAFLLGGVTACFTSVSDVEEGNEKDGDEGKEDESPQPGDVYELNEDGFTLLKTKVDSTNSPVKVDSTITAYVSKSGKSIQTIVKDNYSAIKMSSNKASTTSGEEYGLMLNIKAVATITIEALSKKADNKSAGQWVLLGMDGASDIDSTGSPVMADADLASNSAPTMAPAKLVFENVPAGTYMLGENSVGGGFLYSLKIEYK